MAQSNTWQIKLQKKKNEWNKNDIDENRHSF